MPGNYLSNQGRANEALQDALDRDEPRILASYALIGAILLLGGVGYAIDWWAATSPWFLLVGLAAGILFGFYNLLGSFRRGGSAGSAKSTPENQLKGLEGNNANSDRTATRSRLR